MKNKQFIYLFCLILLYGCSCPKSKGDENSMLSENTEEQFPIFINRFYSDSIFQKSRIVRPLKGGMMNSENGFEEWEKNIKSVPSTKDLSESFPEFNLKSELINQDTMFIEKVWQDNSGFHVEKYFIIRDGKWYLIKMDFVYI